MKLEKKAWSVMFALILELPWAAAQIMPSPAATPTPMAASATTTVPPMIPYSGMALDNRGIALTGERNVTFQIYKDEQGGEPLFTETQNLVLDRSGQYKAELGASLSNGIPMDLFASGEARWLEVQIAGGTPQPRVLLVSVPYALKAADAATLGGLPASAFALAGTQRSGVAATVESRDNVPDANANVTTPGGKTGFLPVFTGSATVGNSILFSTSTGIGVGNVPNSTAVFDVSGKSIWRGLLNVSRAGNATAAEGFDSFPMFFQASSFNSSTHAAVSPNFQLQVEPTGNNTKSPGATFNLLSSATGGNPTETGFFFNSNGTLHFAPGQTFPGTGKITSVGLSAPSADFTVSGSPVTGAGTLGLNWKTSPTNADTANAIVKRDGTGSFVAGAIVANLGMEGITSVAAGNGVAGIHNGGGIAVLGESLTGSGVGVYGDGVVNGVQGVTASGNGVLGQGDVGVWGQSTGTNGGSDGVHGVTGSGGASGVAGVNNAGGIGVYGTGGTGVFGTGSNYGFVTDSNVNQARTAGGWVKAMVEVNPFASPARIDSCFNSTLAGAAATTPPCGIDLVGIQTGIFTVNFHFEVDDRFYSTQLIDAFGTYLQLLKDGPTTIETATWDFAGNLKVAEYQLIVY